MTTADGGWAYRLGLHRPELRAWAMYDWANSAFATTVMGALMGPYFKAVPAGHLASSVSTAYWAYTTSLALLIVALMSPVLGATADFLGAKKRFIGGFAGLGIIFTSFLWFAGSGEWVVTSAVYIVANVGFAAANVFYESLLPSIARREEIDRVSTAGYAVGYVGGGILLAINAAWIMFPERFGLVDDVQAIRLSFVSVSVWWAIFSVPLFHTVREPAPHRDTQEGVGRHPLMVGFSRVRRTFGEIRQYRQVYYFLLAFWLYNDGIGTIIKMATTYGSEVGLGTGALVGALLVTQVVGIPFTFAYGALAGRIGTKRGIQLALVVFTGIAIGGHFIREAWHFYALAVAVGMVMGGSQALSRSLYAAIVPRSKSSEFFGFFSVSEKFAGILGPLVFGFVTQVTGTGRMGIATLVLFFVGGMILLSRVDVEDGRRVAMEVEAALATRSRAT